MNTRFLLSCGLWSLILTALVGNRPALAQSRGYDQIAEISASGEERNRQRDLWMMESHLKPLRLVWIGPPGAPASEGEAIWYLMYRSVNRPIESLSDDSATEPVNTLDPVLQPAMFIPEFTLVTYDDPATEIPNQIMMDSVQPPAVAAINRVEAHRPDDPVPMNSVSIIQEVPPAADVETADPQWLHGIATFKGVSPETDYFKVVMSGFTNAYELRQGANGQPELWRKVLVQRFSRRGDRFDPNQMEFKFEGKPVWEYHPAGDPSFVPPKEDTPAEPEIETAEPAP